MGVIRFIHRLYKSLLSPIFGDRCRFYPSCSDYALHAIETHGIFSGAVLTLARIVKCNPFHPGGIDEVPPTRRA